jgi:hypothetical protein
MLDVDDDGMCRLRQMRVHCFFGERHAAFDLLVEKELLNHFCVIPTPVPTIRCVGALTQAALVKLVLASHQPIITLCRFLLVFCWACAMRDFVACKEGPSGALVRRLNQHQG